MGESEGHDIEGGGRGGVEEKAEEQGREVWDMGPRRDAQGTHCSKRNI